MDEKQIICTIESTARHEFESSIRDMVKVFYGYYCSTKTPDKEQAIARFRNGIEAASRAYDDILEMVRRMEDQSASD